ncbi:multidrug effflux MFS transporter [Ideonella azotifigens]|uniref:Bcr/CflA family efflux transporter n=1 Tax=Ideonella azotifigens TaxID=513160 RepID=A0ABN1JGL2_9BURK|nr:multidrug effflux MFS transporter [Ideonella azotifigens]MCD2344747.1 multidrug effflux MFS transporter [Ideonella azotifigens]
MSVSDTSTALPAAVPAPRLTEAQLALALSLLLGLQPLTTDLYLPALPLLRHALGAGMAAAQLTMSALLLSFGLAQLLMGPLSDRFGRRPVLLGGLFLHALAGVGVALAPDMATLILLRAVQGVGMAASVVCARAMVRDLYEPFEGAQVMSRGLFGLGVIAMLGPVLGGMLAASLGWRAAMAAVALGGALTLLFVWRTLPESLPSRNLQALNAGPLARTTAEVLRHPGFRAWTALISTTYGGLIVLLAGSPFVYIGTLGLAPWAYGLVMASASGSYMLGTLACRRLVPWRGLAGAVRIGGVMSLAGGLLMLACASPAQPPLAGVLVAHWLYVFGHGIHQPCGQAGAVGAFPQAAGLASALSGCILALVAFAIGLGMGRAMNGQLAPLAIGLALASLAVIGVAFTLVRWHGEPRRIAAA